MKTKNERMMDKLAAIKAATNNALREAMKLRYVDRLHTCEMSLTAALNAIDNRMELIERTELAARKRKMEAELERNRQTVQFPEARMTRAYRGKPGCMCGCLGKYFDPGSPAATRILRELNARLNEARFGDGSVVVDYGNTKRIVVYFEP